MSDAWKYYRGAPASGQALCALTEVPDGGTHCFEVNGFPVLMVRKGRDVRAFVNACPHQYLPLNHKGDKLISTDGKVIRCTNHSAGYSAETGEGIEGLGIGECLDAIPVRVATDDIVVVA